MKTILFLILGTFSSMAASFTPESAAVYAARNNPELIAARFVIQEAEGRLIQAGLWRNPEFEVGGEFNTGRIKADRLVSVSLIQKFPLAARLQKARDIARVDVAMSIEELKNQERLLAGNVLFLARNILLIDQRIAIHTRQLSLLDRIVEQTTTQASSGNMDAASIGVVQLERATLALQRESQSVTRDAALAQLAGILGFAPGIQLSIVGALPKIPTSWASDLDRPDLRLASLAADKSLAEQRLARVEKWEDLSVGVGYSREREDGDYDNMAQLKFSIPLPLWDRNQGRVAETESARQRALADVTARQIAIQSEIHEARTRAIGFAKILDQLRGNASRQARQNTTLVEQAVASGFNSFLTIYESRRQSLALDLTMIDTQVQLVTALTDWQIRTGKLPSSVKPSSGK